MNSPNNLQEVKDLAEFCRIRVDIEGRVTSKPSGPLCDWLEENGYPRLKRMVELNPAIWIAWIADCRSLKKD